MNAITDQGRIPLHAASQNGDIYMIKSLLRKGANVNQKVSIHLHCKIMLSKQLSIQLHCKIMLSKL